MPPAEMIDLMNVWSTIHHLRRLAAYNGIYRDFNRPAAVILRRTEKYIERGTLVDPGWSTRSFDPV